MMATSSDSVHRLIQSEEVVRRLRDLQDKAALVDDDSPLHGGGGGGTSDGMDDAWKKSVDDQLKRNADNARALFAATLVIVGMVIGLYIYTGNKSDALLSQLTNVRVEQANQNGDARAMNATITSQLKSIEGRLQKSKD